MARVPSLFIDGQRRQAAPAGSSFAAVASDEWLTGRVTEVLAGGWLEVELPADDPQTVATGPSDGGITQVGAIVRVLRDSSGRITQISSPTEVDTSADAAPLVSMGVTGDLIASAMDDAAGAFEVASAIEGRAAGAEAAASEALTSAGAALSTAEANRPPVVSVDAPSEPVAGLIWYPTNTLGQITGAKVYTVAEDGTGSWLDRPLVGDSVLVPSSVGTVALQDGSVTAPKIYASEELWAKLAAFGAVTTDMLVAGNATITNEMVVNELSGKTIRGSVLSLLDQSPTPSTATARWIDFMPTNPVTVTSPMFTTSTYSASATTSGLTVSFTGGTTTSGLFSDGFGIPMNGVGPVAAVGPVTIKITGKTSYAASGKTFMGTKPVGVGLSVMSNTNTAYEKWSAPTTAGGSFSVSVTIPEGEWINQSTSGSAVTVNFGAGAKKGDTLTVSNVTVSWPPALTTGLQIWRDAKGVARIDIAATDGNAVTLNSSGVTAWDNAGTSLGTISWRTFVAPPSGYITNDAPQSISSSDSYKEAGFSAGTKLLKGGMTMSSNKFTIPVSGMYRLTGHVRFAANSSGIRVIDFGTGGDYSSGGLANVSSVPVAGGSHTMEANALLPLNAGDTIGMGIRQTTGSTLDSTYRDLAIQYVSAL